MTVQAIFEAAEKWDGTALNSLLKQKPQLAKARDRLGRTPLHRLAGANPADLRKEPKDALPIAKALLQTGAELEAVREIGEKGDIFPATPLWYAVARGRNLPLAKFMLARGAKSDWCLWAVVWNEDIPLLDALLKTKPKLDLIAEGETPLIYAVRLRRFAAMEKLLAAGASLTARDAKGRTALDIAVARRYPKAIQAKLKKE